MTVNISDMSSYGYDTPTGVLTVLGRPEPVTVGQVRRAATGDVTFLTLNQEERDRLHYITASGHVLLLQSTQESGVGSMYIALMGVTENRVLPQRDEQERYFTVSYQEVAAPVGAGAPFSTWQDVIDQYPTWQAVIDANTSWFSLIENLGTTTAPPILAWRGA